MRVVASLLSFLLLCACGTAEQPDAPSAQTDRAPIATAALAETAPTTAVIIALEPALLIVWFVARYE
jgi:hypothetical protein